MMRLGLTLVLLSGCNVTASGPSCSDGLLNGDETGVDCGGSCAACQLGQGCLRGRDCLSGYCGIDGLCASGPPSGLPSSAGAQSYSIDAAGAVLPLSPGSVAGYAITANVGGSYRIIWTGDAGASGAYREFSGSIWTTGTFDSFTPSCTDGSCPLEPNDNVSSPTSVTGGQVIDFDAIATNGVDGFDFSATVQPVYFELFIDGGHHPELVYFSSGGQVSSPLTDPFALTTP